MPLSGRSTHCAFAQAGFQLAVLINKVDTARRLADRRSAQRVRRSICTPAFCAIGLRFSVTSSLQFSIHHWWSCKSPFVSGAIADLRAGDDFACATNSTPALHIFTPRRAASAVDLRIARFIGQRASAACWPVNGAAGVVADFAHRRQYHRVLFGEFIDRRYPVAGEEELRCDCWGIELSLKRYEVPGSASDVSRHGHWICFPVFAHFLVSGAVEIRAQMTQLIPDLWCC